ncbi:MAG: glycosyltransferase [Planctomycetes bacterium]|nr:glycosyltransferase [Planctomycetota bacterium]
MTASSPPRPSTAPLDVLLVSHGLPPESVGGVEQHVDGLARALVAVGHRVHVWTKTGRGGAAQGSTSSAPADAATPYAVTRVAYRYEGLDTLLSLYAVPLLDRALAGFLAAHRFDVAHVHHLTGLSTGSLGVLARHRVPTVLTLHDYWLLCPRGQMWHRDGSVTDTVEPARCADCLRPSFGGFVPAGPAGEQAVAGLHAHARALLDIPARLIVPSHRAAPPFVALGVPAERLHAVENGVDVDALRALPLPTADADRPLRVGYLGTLIPSKGLHVLVDALAALPAGAIELHAHGNVVPYHGDASWLTHTLMRVTPERRVAWHGPYHTAELPGILADLDVVAAPALWREAFGLTVREALAAGRPIVVSAIGGLQDAVRDGIAGRVVPPGDVAAWARALGELAADRAAVRAMARRARDEVPVRGFRSMADELVAHYRDVIALARTAGRP